MMRKSISDDFYGSPMLQRHLKNLVSVFVFTSVLILFNYVYSNMNSMLSF